jgi:hypothetical protein
MRWLRCFVAIAAVALLVEPSLAQSDRIDLSYFLVKRILAYEPAINNVGEIVYVEASAIGSSPDITIASTRRGTLTGPSNNVRFPDINNLGEVVYSDVLGPGGLSVISTERGVLFSGNLAGINDLGAVSAVGSIGVGPGGVLLYDTDGSLSLIGLSPGQDLSTTDLSNSGEITYVLREATGTRVGNVVSSTRGPLTHFTTGEGALTHAANNLGQFIYTARADEGDLRLYDQEGRSLWNGTVGGFADINDYGDIVFNIPVHYELDGTTFTDFAIVLGTSRPEFFRHEFKRMPASRSDRPNDRGSQPD